MKPSELESTLQDQAAELVARMVELTKSKDEVVALRATAWLLNRGYGETNKTKRDPWDSEKKQTGVAAMLNQIFNGDGTDEKEGSPADPVRPVCPTESTKNEGKSTSPEQVETSTEDK